MSYKGFLGKLYFYCFEKIFNLLEPDFIKYVGLLSVCNDDDCYNQQKIVSAVLNILLVDL